VGVDFVVVCGTLGLLLVSMFEENKGCFHPRPLKLSRPLSPLLHVVLEFHVLSKNAAPINVTPYACCNP